VDADAALLLLLLLLPLPYSRRRHSRCHRLHYWVTRVPLYPPRRCIYQQKSTVSSPNIQGSMTTKTKLRTSPRLSRPPHLSSALRTRRQRQPILSSKEGLSFPIRQLSFASAVVAGQNAQIKNASTSGLKKEMRRTPTASKKKRRGILSSLYKDSGENVDRDDESSGSYRRQSKSKP